MVEGQIPKRVGGRQQAVRGQLQSPGKVVGKEHESDAKEAKEAKDEAKAKNAKPTTTKPAPANP